MNEIHTTWASINVMPVTNHLCFFFSFRTCVITMVFHQFVSSFNQRSSAFLFFPKFQIWSDSRLQRQGDAGNKWVSSKSSAALQWAKPNGARSGWRQLQGELEIHMKFQSIGNCGTMAGCQHVSDGPCLLTVGSIDSREALLRGRRARDSVA
jgi:hypothetical protein